VQGPVHHHAAAPPLVDRCHFRVERGHGAAMRALKQQSKALNRARKPPTTLQQGQCAGTMPIHSAGKLHQKLAATAGKTFLSKSTSLQAHACRGRPEQGREGSGRPGGPRLSPSRAATAGAAPRRPKKRRGRDAAAKRWRPTRRRPFASRPLPTCLPPPAPGP